MEKIREAKQGGFEYFKIYYDQMERLSQRFMEVKPMEAEIHKTLLFKGASDLVNCSFLTG